MNFHIKPATLGAILFTVSGCIALQAETVSGGVLTSFPSLGTAASPTYGNAYWNNPSGDGPTQNIGWCLTGGGQCTLPGGAPGAMQYYSSTGAAGANNSPSNLFFTSGGGSVSPTLLVSITSQSANDTFGWYSVSGGGTIGAMHPLFMGNQAVTTATFTPSGDYGFYIEEQQGLNSDPFSSQYNFLMDSTANFVGGNDPNSPTDSLQHFAVFEENSNSFYVGANDTRACSATITSSCTNASAFDYNDMVVHVTSVPEPASLALLGAGMVGLVALFRRRKNN